jgi:hypothetical protein
MNPLYKYDDTHSYYDVMIRPLVIALRSAMQKENKQVLVNFALQGEMNRMLMNHPLKWLKLANIVRCMLPKRGSKVGVSVNFNKLCGYDVCDPNVMKTLPSIQRLFSSVDFIGMSSYPSMSAPDDPSRFANGIKSLSEEFKGLGMNLSKLQQNGISLHFSEFGIGGATCSGNGNPASTGIQATPCPWFGMFGTFDPDTNPWRTQSMYDFQTFYFSQLIEWVKGGTDPRYPVDVVYLWNVASWDVAGIYHDSFSSNGTYKNKDAMGLIKKYNDF